MAGSLPGFSETRHSLTIKDEPDVFEGKSSRLTRVASKHDIFRQGIGKDRSVALLPTTRPLEKN